MTKRIHLLFSLLVALALEVSAFGQASLTTTTLAADVSSAANTTVVVSSATGITATNTLIYVDGEAMFVNAVNSTTLSVTRGYNGTPATSHLSGATVYAGPPYYFSNNQRSGSCVSTNERVLPVIDIMSGNIYQCAGPTGKQRWGIVKGFFVPADFCSASTTGTAGTGNNSTILDGSVSALKVASTNAGASHNVFTCAMNVPSGLTAGRGSVVTDIQFLYSQQGTATGLSLVTPLLDYFLAPVASTSETASSATLVTGAGGTLTMTPVVGSANLTAISAGQYYNEQIALGTPLTLATDLKQIVLIVEFDQSGSTATLITTPGFWVHYVDFGIPTGPTI